GALRPAHYLPQTCPGVRSSAGSHQSGACVLPPFCLPIQRFPPPCSRVNARGGPRLLLPAGHPPNGLVRCPVISPARRTALGPSSLRSPHRLAGRRARL